MDNLKPYRLTDFSVESALKIDPRSEIMQDPNSFSQEMYLPGTGGVWKIDREHIFNEAWARSFEQRTGLWVTGAFIFWRRAGYQHPGAHIDAYPRDGVLESVPASFNWVLDSDDSAEMTWYEPWWDADNFEQCQLAAQGKLPHPLSSVAQADFGTMSYQETDPNLLVETHRLALPHDTVTVCRTNIPHTVWMGNKDRWAVSMRIGYFDAPRLWHDLVAQINC